MITVFTPTYNRGYIIHKLYASLLNQTDKNFEWLVVDDGSTDDTERYFARLLQQNNPFPVRYVKQENGGKHRAINRGVAAAKGEIFFIVDSDDCLSADAIEKIQLWVKGLDGSRKFAGVAGLRCYNDEKTIGGAGVGAGGYVDAKNTERKKYNLLGDKAEAYFTDVLRKYPFPEFEGEKFLSEEAVWNKIAADGYYLRWYSEKIYYTEYLSDGLTKAGDKYAKNPQGTLFWARRQLEIFRDKRTRMAAIKRYYFAVKGKKSVGEIAGNLGVSKGLLNLTRFLAFLKGCRS